MRLNSRSRRLATLWPALMCLFAFTLAPGLAQQEVTPEPEPIEQPSPTATETPAPSGEDLGPMEINFDLNRLLFDTHSGNLQDPVWRLSPSPGKRILMLPFTVDNVNRVNKLSRFPISVRTGRLIGFVIPKADAANRSSERVDLNRIIRASPDQLQTMLFESGDENPVANEPAISPGADQAQPTPEIAPRLAREITFHPDGTVRWEMDRSFQAGELQSASEQNLYAYKIDPQQLRDAQPEKAERISRTDGEDAREYAVRKQAHQLAEREKQNAFRELRSSLRELPESFSEPIPSVLYAAMEVPDKDELSFQGPEPFPWTLDEDKKQLLDDLERGANAFEDGQGVNQAGSLITMIKGHPLDARAVAIATMRGDLAGKVEADDPGYELIASLLKSNDLPTRRIALYGVATVTPPSLASAKLIGVAGEAVMGEERKMLSFASLGKLFSTQATDPENAAILIDRVSKAINDPEGPSATRIIERVLDALAPDQRSGRAQVEGEVLDVMVNAVDLSGVTPEEVAGVTQAIIQHSPTHPLAAGWLDAKLLGSTDTDVVGQTLSQLYEAKIEKPRPIDTVSGFEEFEIGSEAEAEAETEVETETETETEAEPVPVDAGTLVLSGSIPMARTDHALVGLFNHEDDLRQAAAWAVLGRFRIAIPDADTPRARASSEDPAQDPSMKMFHAILEMADARDKVPASVVAFMLNQQEPVLVEAANQRLVELMGDPALQQKTARAALGAYLADPERFTRTIEGLASQAKRRLMETMYRSQDQEAPLVSGLIADRGTTLRWLTGYASEHGKLPTAEVWGGYVQGLSEASLVSSAAGGDETLAVASAAALVVRAGGDEKQEQAFAQTVVLMETRTVEEVTKHWEKQRDKIFADAFNRVQGTYTLVATLRQNNRAGVIDEAQADPGKRVSLGVVELRAQGNELSLSVEAVKLSPTPGEFGIRIEEPATLRSFDKVELSKISPTHLTQPIDLLPQDDGTWVGEQSLPDGQTLQSELRKKSAFDSPEQQAYLNLAYTHAQLAADFAGLFKAHGLSEATYNILRVLRGVRRRPEDGQDALPSGEIGCRLVTRVPDVTRLIDRLVKAELVDRTRGEADRRVVRVRITTKGLALLRKLDTPVLDLHRQTLGHMTRSELKQLNSLLERAWQGASEA
eukprot:g12204.t1